MRGGSTRATIPTRRWTPCWKRRVSTDQDERARLYKQMQTIVQEDAPWVFVANWKQNAVTSDAVENFSLQPSFFLLLDDVVKN